MFGMRNCNVLITTLDTHKNREMHFKKITWYTAKTIKLSIYVRVYSWSGVENGDIYKTLTFYFNDFFNVKFLD